MIPTSNSKKTNILIVDPSGLLWGSERSLILLLKHLPKNQFTPYLCCPLNSKLSRAAADIGVKTAGWISADLHKRGLLAKLFSLAGILIACITARPKTIHINQAGATRYGALFAKFLHIGLLIHVRLLDEVQLAVRRTAKVERVKFVAISSAVRKKLVGEGASPKSIHTVFNPIEISGDATNRKTTPLATPGAATLIFIGRICKQKGIEVLLDAMKMTMNRHPNLKLLVLGDSFGAQNDKGLDYLQAMKQRCCELGLQERTRFAGFIADITEDLAKSDILVMPSSNEAWGRVICEAMITGVPVVGSDEGGIPEIIGDNERGFLFPAGSATGLAAAIEQMIECNDEALRRSQDAMKWVKENCSPANHARAIAGILEDLTQNV